MRYLCREEYIAIRLCLLFAARQQRQAVITLLRFHSTIFAIYQTCRTPHIGLQKCRWWRDAVSTTPTPAHPILQTMAHYKQLNQWQDEHLSMIITATEMAIEIQHYPTQRETDLLHKRLRLGLFTLIAQSLHTSSSSCYLNHLAQFCGQLTTYRDCLLDGANGRCFLPCDSLERATLQPYAFMADTADPKLAIFIRDQMSQLDSIRCKLESHLADHTTIPRVFRLLFNVMCALHTQLREHPETIFDQSQLNFSVMFIIKKLFYNVR